MWHTVVQVKPRGRVPFATEPWLAIWKYADKVTVTVGITWPTFGGGGFFFIEVSGKHLIFWRECSPLRPLLSMLPVTVTIRILNRLQETESIVELGKVSIKIPGNLNFGIVGHADQCTY